MHVTLVRETAATSAKFGDRSRIVTGVVTVEQRNHDRPGKNSDPVPALVQK
jgi:hypothetical protein